MHLVPVLALVIAVSANATNRDEGIYCLQNQVNLTNAIKLLNTKFQNEDDFQVPLNTGNRTIEEARLLGVAVDSYYITQWKLKNHTVGLGPWTIRFLNKNIKLGPWKVIVPILRPTQVRRYNVCVAIQED